MSPEWSTFKNARHIQAFFNTKLRTQERFKVGFYKQHSNNCFHVTYITPE